MMISILRKERLLKPQPEATVTVRNAELGVRNQGHSALSAVGPVFTINFIRSHQAPLLLRRALLSVTSGYLIASVALLMWLLGMSGAMHGELAGLHRTHGATLPTSGAVHGAARELDTVATVAQMQLDRLNGLMGVQRQSVPVAGKLAALTRTLPARTWITGLSGQQEGRTITIQAAYLIDPDAPYQLPAKAWIEALRADPAFGQGLSRLVLETSLRTRQGTAEVFTFALAAQWAGR